MLDMLDGLLSWTAHSERQLAPAGGLGGSLLVQLSIAAKHVAAVVVFLA
jgi:hypothetical protein